MSAYLASLSGLWLVEPQKGQELAEFARLRLAGWRPDADTRQAYQDARAARLGRQGQRGTTAVIPIQGVLVHRGNSLQASSGATSSEVIGRMVDEVAAAEDVGHVVFDVDSPGGHVSGIVELAAKIRRLSARKPTTAVANSLAASAAYWLACACNEIFITPSGEVGSIGVYQVVVDESARLERRGIKVHPIVAGDHKLERAPFLELSSDARAHLQAQVDRIYRHFVGAVATGRHVTEAQVLKRFGQGRLYLAEEAVARGMADGVADMDSVLARVTGAPGVTAFERRKAESEIRRLNDQAALEETLGLLS